MGSDFRSVKCAATNQNLNVEKELLEEK